MSLKTVGVYAVAAVVMTSAGCSSSADAPAQAPMALVDYLRAMTQLGCERSFTCCTAPKDADSSMAKTARSGATSPEGCASIPDVPGGWMSMKKPIEDAEQRGSMVFHGEQAAACIAAQHSRPCADFFSTSDLVPVPAACVGVFDGKLQLGAACELWQECPIGAGCVSTQTGLTCQKIPAPGETCTGYCPDLYWCDPSSSKCTEPKPEGASCEPATVSQCQGVCDQDSKKCGPPIDYSAACVGG